MNWQVVKDLVNYGREQERSHDKSSVSPDDQRHSL